MITSESDNVGTNNTREACQVSFDATEADTMNLLGPPLQTNQRIEDAKN